jgi:hypothetical protein
MPRSRQRICLQQQALRLDISWLVRRQMIAPGTVTSPHSIRWVNSDGKVLASGCIHTDTRGDVEGLFHIQIGEFDQTINLVTLPRHLGGRQWFFVCPVTNRRASVLWLPCGAQQFASKHAWPGRLPFAIHDGNGSSPSRHGEDQAAADR